MKRVAILFAPAILWAGIAATQQAEPPLPGEAPLENAEIVLEGEARAPDPDEAEGDGFLLRLIQNLLSAPGREVRISGVSGVLSSRATIAQITVSDAEGVWLRVENVGIDWSRRALFLRRVQVSELTIGEIDYLRLPIPPEPAGPRLADAEARPFALPELPLAVRVEDLDVGRVVFREPVFGQEAALAAGGYLTLEGGELDTDLGIRRLDGPGGELRVQAAYSNVSREVDLDVALSEPPGGIVATLLDIEGQPAIDLALQGAGPLEDVDLSLALDADATRLAQGEVSLRETAEGLAFGADFAGVLAPLVPAEYRAFFAGESRLQAAGLTKDAGGVRLDRLAIAGAALALEGDLETGPDGFLTRLTLAGTIGDPEAPPLTLPVPGAQTRIDSGTVDIAYGDFGRWQGRIALAGVEQGDIGIASLTLDMGGTAQDLADPAARTVTILATGEATGIRAEDPDVQAALGDRLDLVVDVVIPSDGPIQVGQFEVDGAGLRISTSGIVQDLVLTGRHVLRATDLAPFSGLAGRELGGAIDIVAEGDLLLASGGFDLVLDGTATGLTVDDPRLDALLAGRTVVSGRIARDEGGLVTDGFRVANPQLSLASTGRISGATTDIGFRADLADLALVVDDASGALSAEGRATGREGAIDVALQAAIPSGELLGQPLAGLDIGFDGSVIEGNVAGALRGEGTLAGDPIALQGALAVADETRSLSDFRLSVGRNVITGDIAQQGEAPLEGTVAVDAPDAGRLAALALVEASGAVNATIGFVPAAVGQGIAVGATGQDLALAGVRIGAFDLEAEVEDAFGVPLADATLAAEDVLVAGVELARLDARADQNAPDTMTFAAETRLAIGTEAALSGTLERLADGLALQLDRLVLEQEALRAELVAPATITVQDETVTLTALALQLGDGRIEAEGVVAETIDIGLTISGVALALADAVVPDLGLRGVVDGTATVTGRRDRPQIAFNVTAADVTAAPLAEAGLPPVTLEATGDTVGDVLALDAVLAGPDGLSARAAGTVPITDGALDLALDLDAFPLALVDPALGGQGLEGTLTGTARATGTLEAPAIGFDLGGAGISAALTRDAGLPPAAIAATGSGSTERFELDARATLPDLPGVEFASSGVLEDMVFGGRHIVRIPDLAPFSGLADRPLAGALELEAAGDILLATGGVDLALQGTARDVRLGEPQIDPLLAGATAISGRVARDESGLRADTLNVSNPQIAVSADGVIAQDATEIAFRAELADLALILPEATGALTASGRAVGPADAVEVTVEAAVPEGSLLGQRLTGLVAGFDGTVSGSDVTGTLRGRGSLAGSPITLGGDIALVGQTRSVEALQLAVGPNAVTGDLVQRGDAPVEGNLVVRAPNLRQLAALALVEAEGAADAVLRLGPAEVGQGVTLAGTARNLAFAGNRVAALAIEAEVEDAFGVPLADATLTAEGIVAGGIELVRLDARAERATAEAMAFSAETQLAIGTEAALAGTLERLADGLALTLERLTLEQEDVRAELVAPATVTIQGDEVLLTPLALDLGDGRLEAEGAIGERIDIDVTITALSLALADTVVPELGLAGLVDGTARVTGSRDAPQIGFDIVAAGVTAAPLRDAGLPPVRLEATGETVGDALALDAVLSGPGGLSASAAGRVPVGEGPIELAIDLAALPLALVDPAIGNQGLQGVVTGTATVTGTIEAPEVSFDLSGTGLSAGPTREAGLPAVAVSATGRTADGRLNLDALLTGPAGLNATATGSVPLGDGLLDLSIDLGTLPLSLIDPAIGNQGLLGTVTGSAQLTGTTAAPQAGFTAAATGVSTDAMRQNLVPPLAANAAGQFADNTLTLTSATVTGPGNISATASGVIPLDGPGLNVTLAGGLPLSLADAALAERAAQLAGRLDFNLAVTGSLADPQIAGPATIAGGTFVDPGANIRLENINADAALTGQSLVIDSFTAQSAFGGRVQGAGSVALDAAGFPVDLQITFVNFAYSDGAFVTTTLDGTLAISGPVAAGSGTVAGALDLGVTEISVAEGLGTTGALALEAVDHRNAPPGVLATLGRARIEEAVTRQAIGAAGIQLDVLVRAPNQIYIRGRGLDVELGGEIRVQGSVTDIQPVGQFELIRGRLGILGQRIEFDEGSLQLVGNLDPIIFFVARTETEGAIAIITVSGRASAPEITFSSIPELPQDEILALIIFNRSAQQLTPFQIAQLAAAAAELAGAGGNGLLSQFRGAFGLDDLDIIADETGGAAVRAGRYIDDNIYLDVQTGTGGDTRVTINLDITRNVTARGSVGTDGNSRIGIYYERDY